MNSNSVCRAMVLESGATWFASRLSEQCPRFQAQSHWPFPPAFNVALPCLTKSGLLQHRGRFVHFFTRSSTTSLHTKTKTAPICCVLLFSSRRRMQDNIQKFVIIVSRLFEA